MKIVTSMGYEYAVDWIDTPVQNENRLLFQMQTDSPLSEIVAEFDGLEWIERHDEEQGDKHFEGYSRLAMVQIANGKATLMMERGEG